MRNCPRKKTYTTIPSAKLTKSYWSHGPVESWWIFPLIAWWIFPLLCKRLPEGSSRVKVYPLTIWHSNRKSPYYECSSVTGPSSITNNFSFSWWDPLGRCSASDSLEVGKKRSSCWCICRRWGTLLCGVPLIVNLVYSFNNYGLWWL
jgi:hypothetical protein